MNSAYFCNRVSHSPRLSPQAARSVAVNFCPQIVDVEGFVCRLRTIAEQRRQLPARVRPEK